MTKIFRLSVFLFIFFVSNTQLFSQQYFSTRLSHGELTLADSTVSDTIGKTLAGTGVFILGGGSNSTVSNNDLRFIISVGNSSGKDSTSGKKSILRAVHFHLGAVGDTGRMLRSFTSGFTGNTLSGTWGENSSEPLTSALRNELMLGNVYVIAITDSGEIRGQIKPSSGTPFVAHITAPQVPDSSASKASGVGSFLYTDLGLIYLISVQGMNVLGSNLHMGGPGEFGPSVGVINFKNNMAFGLWPLSFADTANNAMIKALLSEMIFITVNSTQYRNGEIRGQLLHAGGFAFSSPLSGRDTQEDSIGTGSQNSALRGNASYTLTPHGLVYHINLMTKGNKAVVYFKDNMTGQQLKSIPSFADSSVSGAWLINDSQTSLSDAMVSELFQGRISLAAVVNNDTLQGIVTPHKQTSFTALLTGLQERPRVVSKASGVGHFILDGEGLRYYITIEGINSITAAHFHMAPVGVPGGVVKSISFDSSGTASGVWKYSGDQGNSLTPVMVDALLKGDIYVNVHTPAHPNGEIRGQLVPASGTNLKAHFTRRQTSGSASGNNFSGTANFILSNEGLVYKITIDSMNVSGFDFSRGPVGQIGQNAFSINVSSDTGRTYVGVWRRSNAGAANQALNDTLVGELLTGNIYITARSAAGITETLRGQIEPNGGVGFVSMFNSTGNGNPAAFESANGAASYTLSDAGIKYNMALDGFKGNAATIVAGASGPGTGTSQLLNGSFTNGVMQGAWLMLGDTTAAAGVSGLFANNLLVQLQSTDSSNHNLIQAPITRDFSSPATGVFSNKSVPASFSLEQNYPNPFNPSTVIRFSIPENGIINLSVFNIIGEKVSTLIDQQNYKAGRYEIKFDGSRLSSGVYFYRLNYGSNFTTKKMLLIK